MLLFETYSIVLKNAKEPIPGPASESHCKRPVVLSSRSSSRVAVHETDSKSSGKNVTLSIMIGPYVTPRVLLILNRKNCITGMYAAMSGSSWTGRRGRCRRMSKFDDHPMKQAVITPFECHIDAGIPPKTGDRASWETFE